MQAEYKIIADHLRSSCFLIADGVLPSNEGRGYVLRRIMRRAMRQIHKLGAKQAMMYKFSDLLIAKMGEAFPELVRGRELIIETLKNEEEKFRETLEKGLKILEDEIKNTKILNGEIAFKLYDTYGFPLDLTQDILKEKNIEIDLQGFEKAMEQQKKLAKANWKGSGEILQDQELLKLQENIAGTEFVGYENYEFSAKILHSEANLIILDKTPFYATSGGQKGDDGLIFNQNFKFEVQEAKKTGKLFIHYGKIIDGAANIGDEVTAKINKETRNNRAKNHSATHLLHKALKIILGNIISQKGSNVDANYFTFDFNFNRAMTLQEIEKAENLVNFYIKQNSATKTAIMNLEEARASGAEALFGEKYDNDVRVISMGFDEENKSPYSIELCGGTHVSSTLEIEFFKIISEKSVASGIRRIEAMTGKNAKKFVLDEVNELQEKFMAQNLIISKNQDIVNKNRPKFELENFNYDEIKQEIQDLRQKIEKQEQEIKIINKQEEQEKQQNLLKTLEKSLKIEKIGEIDFITHIFEEIEAKDLREIANSLKNKHKNTIFALFSTKQDKISAIVAICDDLIAKFDASVLIKDVVEAIGGKGGGGKKDIAMGGGVNFEGIKKAIEAVKLKI